VKLIVGLGNPGANYNNTRHNIGFLAADNIADRNRLIFKESSFNAQISIGTAYEESIIIAKSQTYMNLSGEAVSAITEHYNLLPEDIIVIHDDMDIEFGRIKIKTRGGSAGHRGIESITHCQQSDEFLRIRVGIGKPAAEAEPVDFVLQNFTEEENKTLTQVLDNINDCILTIYKSGPETAMNKFHTINNQTK
jgi:PTH1 family peptidyl-tRNA hydrolase